MLIGLGLPTLWSANYEDCCVRLARPSNHVLDEVPVAGGVDDGEVVLVGLEPTVGHVYGEAALPLFLEVIHDPGELKGGLALLLGLLLELLNDVGLDVPRVQKQPPDEGGLTVIHMANEDHVQVRLLWHRVSSDVRCP